MATALTSLQAGQLLPPFDWRCVALSLTSVPSTRPPALTSAANHAHSQSLLCDPNCASPANPEAATFYTTNRKEYNR